MIWTNLKKSNQSSGNEISRSTVYTFDITTLEGFERLWQAVLDAAVVPDGFDHEEFLSHIGQPHLRALSDAIECPPTPDIVRLEKDAVLLALKNRSYPTPRCWYYTAGSGVVNLKYFMKGIEDWSYFDSFVSELFNDRIKARGHFLYPPQGFRNWHTNVQNEEGWVMYVVRVDKDRESFFRYIDINTNEMRTLWDYNGAVNIFYISKTIPFWHSIKSLGAYRWSRGFLIPDDWADHL